MTRLENGAPMDASGWVSEWQVANWWWQQEVADSVHGASRIAAVLELAKKQGDVRQLLGDLAAEVTKHYSLAGSMNEQQKASGARDKDAMCAAIVVVAVELAVIAWISTATWIPRCSAPPFRWSSEACSSLSSAS